MNKTSLIPGILLLFCLSIPAHSETYKTGGNVINETWTPAGSPYIVSGDLTIPTGSFLTIQAGTVVRFVPGDAQASGTDVLRSEIIVNGTLNSNGLSASYVTFTSNSSTPSNSDWYGIVIGPSGVVNMTFSQIEYCVHDIQPGAAGTITGASTVCGGSTDVVYSVPTIARATYYVWILPNFAMGTSTTNSISVSFDQTTASGNIKVIGRNAYGDGVESSFAITVNNPPAQPAPVSGNTTICAGSSNTYNTDAVSGATSYTWTLPSGWTGMSTTNSINTTASTTSGNISVTANNTCPSVARALSVTVNSAPAQPGPISGNATICSGSSNTYSVTAVSGATSYTWTLPNGWTGSSTTNSINTISSSTSGNISVTANTGDCPSMARTFAIAVNAVPLQPGTISGNATTCSGISNTYSIAVVSGATSYTWTLPGGWTGSSTTNSITTTAGTTSGDISVTANNTCGSSPSGTLSITVNSIPAQPVTISGNATVCSGTSTIYSITAVNGATTYSWTLPGGWSGSSVTNSITATSGTTSGDITVTANNTCGSSPTTTLGISVTTTPPQPIVSLENSDVAESTLVSSSEDGNQWFRNDIAIVGATNNILIVTQTGDYSVEVEDNGCTSPRSDAFPVNITGIEDPAFATKLQIFPNPAKQTIVLDIPDHWQSCEAYIYDNRGRSIENIDRLSDETVLNISHYAEGLYLVIIRTNHEYHRMKFVKVAF